MHHRLSSMTGFGRSVLDAPFGKLVVEVQSVNRKQLDIFISSPRELTRFEPEIRRWIGNAISRGNIQVRIYVQPTPESAAKSLPDAAILHGLKTGWEQIASKAGFAKSEVTLSFLMLHSSLQQSGRIAEESDKTALEECVQNAICDWTSMREKEGSALAQDLHHRLSLLRKHLHAVEGFAPEAALKIREQLLKKMEELFAKKDPELMERIEREAILYAEKGDIVEEIVRLKAHFGQMEEILQKAQAAVGRKIDFLIQEMGREINTIGSKSADVRISHLVVELKSELERMREQVQNIE